MGWQRDSTEVLSRSRELHFIKDAEGCVVVGWVCCAPLSSFGAVILFHVTVARCSHPLHRLQLSRSVCSVGVTGGQCCCLFFFVGASSQTLMHWAAAGY
jgi:hypothetical protein